MTAYILRLIAIVTMVIDHSGYIIYHGNISWMNYIGRIAFPIFAFQISEGYSHTHNVKKYFMRLITFALISQIPYAWFQYCIFSKISFNIIFTLILGLLAIKIYDFLYNKGKEISTNNSQTFSYKLLGFVVAIGLAILGELLKFDYGFYGVFIIFLFYLCRNNKLLMNIAVTIITFIYYTPYFLITNFSFKYIGLFTCSLLPLIFINLYNGKKGKNQRMIFYIFYPVHLLILCLIYQIIR